MCWFCFRRPDCSVDIYRKLESQSRCLWSSHCEDDGRSAGQTPRFIDVLTRTDYWLPYGVKWIHSQSIYYAGMICYLWSINRTTQHRKTRPYIYSSSGYEPAVLVFELVTLRSSCPKHEWAVDWSSGDPCLSLGLTVIFLSFSVFFFRSAFG